MIMLWVSPQMFKANKIMFKENTIVFKGNIKCLIFRPLQIWHQYPLILFTYKALKWLASSEFLGTKTRI